MSSLLSVGILSMAELECVIEQPEMVEGAAPRKSQRLAGREGGGSAGGCGSACTNTDASATISELGLAVPPCTLVHTVHT
jgi:hypothetical protein